jgi:hypothetical protein
MSVVKPQSGLLVWDGGARRRTGDEIHPSGTIVHWDERQPPQGVAITCHHCGRKRFTHCTNVRSEKWSGLCHECLQAGRRLNKYPANGELPTGSFVHWDEPVLVADDGRHAWVTCGICRQKRIASVPTGKDRLTWTGFCVPCSGVYRRKRSQDETHVTGTIIHWGERDPADPHNRVLITCHRCRGKSFTHTQSIKHVRWSGLCGECIEERGSPRKFTHDEQFDGGTIIHWGEPDPAAPSTRLMATCGQCRHKRSITRVTASTLKRHNGAWRCRRCHNDSLRSHFASQRQAPEGSQQPAQKARARGRVRGVKYINPQSSRAALESAIKRLWAQSQSISSITFPAVAGVFQAAGERIGPDAVRKRFNDCGTGQKWRDFVVSVIG